MTDFLLYVELGFRHIADLAGYDHIVFVVALCGGYALRDWKHIALLATAFTIGHSITLALATMGIVLFPTNLIEFLIPVTICITALLNIVKERYALFSTTGHIFSMQTLPAYTMALVFGCIHGLGFSNYLRALLGNETSLLIPLWGFNCGLEIGQLLIMSCTLGICWLCVQSRVFNEREWNIFSSGAVFGIALTLIAKTWLW
jgi:membrane-associated HD superfamily phosphohydrolase